ncbi:MAG: shikimate kinase [Deltaproteobacteria bacterium]|nr:shikimate kinase [Candidatus Anaeroferrophillus wilburensis]MBN2888103.1 shikimate kinase [Deltaproteobacteria bacterium]
MGKKLSAMLQRPFIDLDEFIEKREQKSIVLIFQDEGEAYFRRVEEQALADILNCPPLVLATGGGTVLSPQNRALMQTKGTVIFLDASLETIAARTAGCQSRPLLQNSGTFRIEKIKGLLQNRKPLYETAALKIKTDNLSLEQIARLIVKKISPTNR